MGEAREPRLRPKFDRRIKVEFHGARITSDGGLLAYRELDDALGVTEIAITQLLDGRRGKNARHGLGGLLRESVFGRLAGYEDVNDAERLAHDPAMRAIVGREGLDRAAASMLDLFDCGVPMFCVPAQGARDRSNRASFCEKEH